MQTEKNEDAPEKLVIPLYEIVAYPGSRTKFPVDPETGAILIASMADKGTVLALGLTLKSGTRLSEVTTESFYKTGNLFRVTHIQPADHGYLACAEAELRVKAVSLTEKDRHFVAAYEPVPDVQDLEDDLKGRILADVKEYDLRYQPPFLRLRAVHPADREDGLGRPDHGIRDAVSAGEPCREAGPP